MMLRSASFEKGMGFSHAETATNLDGFRPLRKWHEGGLADAAGRSRTIPALRGHGAAVSPSSFAGRGDIRDVLRRIRDHGLLVLTLESA
jgi:hypothetical protein